MKPWTVPEVERLRAMVADGLKSDPISKALGRSAYSVKHKCVHLKIKMGRGRQRKLTRTQDLEVWAWNKAVRELGTHKTLAAKFGVSISAIRESLGRMRKAEAAGARESRRAFMKQLATLPF